MGWIRLQDKEVLELRRRRRRQERRYGVIFALVTGLFITLFALVSDYANESAHSFLKYVLIALFSVGVLVLVEPLFQTKWFRAWTYWVLRYGTTLGRVKRSLYGGIPPADNPDLYILDYLNEAEKCFCTGCHWVQPQFENPTQNPEGSFNKSTMATPGIRPARSEHRRRRAMSQRSAK